MTEDDKELLLILAAKAAGISCEWIDGEYSSDGLWLKGERTLDNNKFWNPLVFDGDALRLAVKMQLDICFCANYIIVGGSVQTPLVNNANDPNAATRFAIVKAAAEIGREIP